MCSLDSTWIAAPFLSFENKKWEQKNEESLLNKMILKKH